MAYFLIVSRQDVPLYECELSSTVKARSPGHVQSSKDESSHLHQFILHAALDMVEERLWDTNSCYLKVVDKFNDLLVSAYVTGGHARFLMLHEARTPEHGIIQFFSEVHELYVKVCMNPFHNGKTPVTSPRFDSLVRALAKKHLT